jgi:hypothetical protein
MFRRVDKACPVRYIPTLYHWQRERADLGDTAPPVCGPFIAAELNSDETEESLRLAVARFVREVASGQG